MKYWQCAVLGAWFGGIFIGGIWATAHIFSPPSSPEYAPTSPAEAAAIEAARNAALELKRSNDELEARIRAEEARRAAQGKQ